MSLSSVEGAGGLRSPDMSTPSPGPGWWMASDGKWYPQKWEYTYRAQPANRYAELLRELDSLGQQGWELVSVTTYGGGGIGGQAATGAWLKRPLAP
jgi:hypothetical protein